ncbi:MAG: hypothetical protein LBT99_02380 [Bifidobacteriaceae bacterium]|jgi:hypothetical protein|nr:hypothetical protein [Bifidobacteriaceae bacterium]
MFNPVAFSQDYEFLGFSLLILSLGLFLTVILLFKFKPNIFFRNIANKYLQATAKMRIKEIYNKKLNALAKEYKANLIDDDYCFSKLSTILREYAAKKAQLNNDNLTLRDIKAESIKNDGWVSFRDIFVKLYGSEFGFSRQEFSPSSAIICARQLVNKWK